MKGIHRILLSIGAATVIAATYGCHEIEKWDNDYYSNFDALWTVMDQHYCFFEEKGVDWDAVGKQYRAAINPEMDYKEFFKLCAAMLDELRDGHTNLSSWFEVSYYRNWWSDYPQNFDWRLIQDNYIGFDYVAGGGMYYKLIHDDKIGYVYYPSFTNTVSDSFVNEMMLTMRDCWGMIIDVRDNGGGELTNVETLVSHFIVDPTVGGYIQHKTGPGHSDFSEPYPIEYKPAEGVRWLKPVIILTNRSTYSAANTFVAVMKGFEHVAVIGDITGGGSGMPFTSEIPCGWAVRMSASPTYDASMQLTENGVEPTEGGRIDMDPLEKIIGHDSILDLAIKVLEKVGEEIEKDEQQQAVPAAILATIETSSETAH